ncbi:hypothetical protein Tco_0927505, partial [Tanacetum coccineum]
SVEDLVHTLSESDGISESECDLPVYDDSSSKKDEVLDDIISIPPGNGNDHFNDESSLIESVLNHDNVIYSPKIDFLLEEFAGELALIAPILSGIVKADFDSKGDIYDSETVIDSNNDYSLSDNDLLYSDEIDYVEASPPDSELVSLEVVEIVILEVGGIDTDILLTIKDDILREKYYEAFFCDSEPDSGNFTMDAVEDIFYNPTREPRVHMPNVLPTIPPFNWIPISLFLRFLSPNEFSISFIRDPLFPVFDTLLPFSSENEGNVFNPDILASNEEKSPHLLSYRGFKAFQFIFERLMMIYGENIPILDVSFLHFYPP